MKEQRLSRVQTTRFYKKIAIAFGAGVLLVLAAIIYFSFTKTTVTISIVPKEVSATFFVNVFKDAAQVEAASSPALLGQLVSTELTKTKTFENTNTGAETPAQAEGTVTIYNNWSSEQPLAATTRLLTPDGTLFRIKDRVDVPAGGTLENVAVYADQPGAAGNIEPTKFTIPGLWPGLQDKIYAESTEAMTGGMRSAKTVTQSLVTEARATLLKEMLPEAVDAVKADSGVQTSSAAVLEQMVSPIDQTATTQPPTDSEGATFDLTLAVHYLGVVFDQADLTKLANDMVKDQLADDQQLQAGATGTLTYTVDSQDLEAGVARLSVTYTAAAVPRRTSPIFDRQALTTLDEQDIKARLANYDAVTDVTVHFSPFWMRHASKLRDHIEIVVRGE